MNLIRLTPAKGQDNAMPSSSIYLAKLLGPVLLAVGFSMVVGPSGYIAMASDLLNDTALVYVAAVIGLIGGIALVLAHNIWIGDWPLIITLLGWISIVDSLTWIVLTRTMQTLWAPLLKFPAVVFVGGLVVLPLGAMLCYFGYRASKPIGRNA